MKNWRVFPSSGTNLLPKPTGSYHRALRPPLHTAPALPSAHKQSYLPHAYTPYPCTPTLLLCTNPAAFARLLHQLCTPEPSSPLARPALLYPTPCHTCTSAAAPNQPLGRLPLSAPEPLHSLPPFCLLPAWLRLYALITCLFPERIASRSRTHYRCNPILHPL
ncbi:hypothetical protein SLEP1_g8977 [Rubroshorea leprosula]|uniref:Uncharacterized protein n=1 Tax=Rubroshorea leprosula TaxID=152421 RepID=A0AAV5I9F1_9ROSI|nr:hypothetical protein SLEP1_g8977 [Rubroshorea leprosula]